MTIVSSNLSFLSQHTMDVPERPYSPDVMVGAYLMSHLRQFCENCGTCDTPQWRKGWHSEVLNRSVLLCNACGLKYHKNQFCPHCHFVYGKDSEKYLNSLLANSTWLSCQSCGRWVHKECEINNGLFTADMLAKNPHSYRCPTCIVNATAVKKNPSEHHQKEKTHPHHHHHHHKKDSNHPTPAQSPIFHPSPQISIRFDELDKSASQIIDPLLNAMQTD